MADVRSATERAIVTVVEDAKARRLPLTIRHAVTQLAGLHAQRGRLRRAAAAYEEAQRALRLDVPTGTVAYYFGRGELLREWNELDEAERVLTRGADAITETNIVFPQVAVNGYIALARVRQARGDHHAAVAALDDFAALARQRNFPEWAVARGAAARAHLWLMQGNLAAAVHWADASGCALDDEVEYRGEVEHLVLARVRIAQNERSALVLLDRLLADAEAFGRMRGAIQMLTFRAVARRAFGDRTGALADLERALALGEPEGYVRAFVDEGRPMAALLRDAYARGIAPEYITRLLDVLGRDRTESGRRESRASSRRRVVPDRHETRDALAEALTERERVILHLVAGGASNKEIAATLFLATGTVKWHIHHIFGKLGVGSRTQAIAMGRALQLE